ncbi:MAG: MFS transporter [Rhodospirillaceae bacterium]|nr:MAG: MFS transporter [Rhodospirillaceae bacterium]
MSSAWSSWLKVYRDRRLLITLFLGFSSGLPLLLTAGTLSARLLEAGITKTVIGLFAFAASAYTLKFLWSPIVDQMPLPLLTGRFGQRRAWMLVAQALLIVGLVGLGFTDPAAGLRSTVMWAVVVAFASATQDLAIDAYRIELLDASQLGAGAAMNSVGYRVALLVAGGGALILAQLIGWSGAYVAMAVLTAVGFITALVAPTAPTSVTPVTGGYGVWMHHAVVEPLADFLKRPGWLLIFAFIPLYKYAEGLIGIMANPFYLEIGFTKVEIGLISKTYGFAMTVVGGLMGGALVARMGIMRTLLLGSILQIAANLVFAAQAVIGHSIPALMVTISVDNISNGIAGVASIAFLSSLCNKAYTATQYALLTAFMAFARTVLSSGGGWLADQLGWVKYFLTISLAALPGLVLLLIIMRRFPDLDVSRAPKKA